MCFILGPLKQISRYFSKKYTENAIQKYCPFDIRRDIIPCLYFNSNVKHFYVCKYIKLNILPDSNTRFWMLNRNQRCLEIAYVFLLDSKLHNGALLLNVFVPFLEKVLMLEQIVWDIRPKITTTESLKHEILLVRVINPF